MENIINQSVLSDEKLEQIFLELKNYPSVRINIVHDSIQIMGKKEEVKSLLKKIKQNDLQKNINQNRKTSPL